MIRINLLHHQICCVLPSWSLIGNVSPKLFSLECAMHSASMECFLFIRTSCFRGSTHTTELTAGDLPTRARGGTGRPWYKFKCMAHSCFLTVLCESGAAWLIHTRASKNPWMECASSSLLSLSALTVVGCPHWLLFFQRRPQTDTRRFSSEKRGQYKRANRSAKGSARCPMLTLNSGCSRIFFVAGRSDNRLSIRHALV